MSENPTPSLSDDQQNRLVDLLIQRATTGLLDSEQQELDHLTASLDNRQELERFEAVAAAFDLSISSLDFEPMPADVHDRLLVSAGKQIGANSGSIGSAISRSLEHDAQSSNVELSKRVSSSRTTSSPSFRWRELGAIAVAAASLMLVLSGFNPFSKTQTAPVASVFDQLEQFSTSPPSDLVDVLWQPVHNPAAGGNVLWSDDRQEGYMVFSGMEINDPAVEQYQLWIFDNDPNQAAPTNGGVFNISESDIGPDGKVLIPIRASVPVGRAVQFAVTIETPGGVYVSEREQIPVLATVESD